VLSGSSGKEIPIGFLVVDLSATVLDLAATETNCTLRWSQNLATNLFTLQSSLSLTNGFAEVTDPSSVVDDLNQIIFTDDYDTRYFRLIEAD